MEIAILEINECWFTSEIMSLNDIKKYPFFQQEYITANVLAIALAVSYHHSVYEHTGNLFLIFHAVICV